MFSQLHEKLKGDSLIGKKLFYLFSQTSFKSFKLSMDPEVHYYGESNFTLWIDNLFMNVKGAEKSLIEFNLATSTELEHVYEELEVFKVNKYASTYFCWNRLKATK